MAYGLNKVLFFGRKMEIQYIVWAVGGTINIKRFMELCGARNFFRVNHHLDAYLSLNILILLGISWRIFLLTV